MITHNFPGIFIAFEGLDGSGSSSQSERLGKKLRAAGHKVMVTKEPTNNLVGGLIRGVLTKDWSLPPEGLQLLFAADRSHHLSREIIPGLKAGKIVITDRYAFSTLAFGSLGVDSKWLKSINSKFILPDITFLFKVAPRVCIERIGRARHEYELFEEEAKLTKVWQAYHRLAQNPANNIIVIDGEKSIEDVEAEIGEMAKRMINERLIAKSKEIG